MGAGRGRGAPAADCGREVVPVAQPVPQTWARTEAPAHGGAGRLEDRPRRQAAPACARPAGAASSAHEPALRSERLHSVPAFRAVGFAAFSPPLYGTALVTCVLTVAFAFLPGF